MPISYDILPELDLVTIRYHGLFSLDDVHQFFQKIWADQRYNSAYDAVIDLSEATTSMTSTEIEMLCGMIMRSSQASTGRLAMIVTGFVATMLSMHFRKFRGEDVSIELFNTHDQAYNYLGRDVITLRLHEP